MRLSTILGYSLVSLGLPFATLASPHAHHGRRHHFGMRSPNETEHSVDLHKRFDGARFTFYDVGLGACGQVNQPGDFIVALNADQFGSGYPGPNCFRPIVITCNGRTTTATIMDRCPGCPFAGLDFSRGLFNFFADEGAGVISGSWVFADEAPAPPPQAPAPPPPPPPPPPPLPPTPEPQPTTTQEAPPPTPTQESTTEEPTTTVTSTESVNLSSGPASGLAESTGVIQPTPGAAQNLLLINQAVVGLGSLVVAGARAASP